MELNERRRIMTIKDIQIDNRKNLKESLDCSTDHWIDQKHSIAIHVFNGAEDISPLYDTSDNLDYFFDKNTINNLGGTNCTLTIDEMLKQDFPKDDFTAEKLNQPLQVPNGFIQYIAYDYATELFHVIDKSNPLNKRIEKLIGRVLANTSKNESAESLQQLIKADLSMLNNFYHHNVFDIYVTNALNGKTLEDGLLESVYPDIGENSLSKTQIINMINDLLNLPVQLNKQDFVPAKYRLISEPIEKEGE